MSCKAWQDPITLDVGGNLPVTEAAALREHLQSCAACQRYAEEMAASQQALRRFAERPLEEASLVRIRAGVLQGVAERESGRLLRFPARFRPARRWLALAASLIAAFTLWQLQEVPMPSAESPAVPTPPVPSLAAPSLAAPTPILTTPPIPTPPIPTPAVATTAPTSLPPSLPNQATRNRWHRNSAEIDVSSESFSLARTLPSSSLVILEPSLVTAPTEPVLRRLSQRESYTIYWLDEPADPLKEKEDANTKVL